VKFKRVENLGVRTLQVFVDAGHYVEPNAPSGRGDAQTESSTILAVLSSAAMDLEVLMSKKAIIFHGTGGRPEYAWYAWLGKRLESRGYTVEIPHYPDMNREPIETFLPKVLSAHVFDRQTVLVGHSGGAALLLSILQHVDVVIPQAILAAGYATAPNTEEEPVLQSRYDWEKIKANVRDIYFLNSTNDPYGCDDRQGRAMFDRLGGTQIIRGDGHFGSPDQQYPTFELLDRLVD
jgi:predicted alpha/beta hydrolase family esterase